MLLIKPKQLDMVEILKAIYPIGSIYFNASVTTNPETLLGFGTWSIFGEGEVPVGYDSTDTDFDALEEVGGEKTHLLIDAEMPVHTHVQDSHNHTQNAHGHRAKYAANMGYSTSYHGPSSTGSNYKATNTWYENTTPTNIAATAVNQNAGGDTAHNNLQPYIVTCMWKRTA